MAPVLFVGFALLLVLSSVMVILHKNPVTSALFLVSAFCSLAGIYLLMHAEFLGMVQVIVYAGAIMVLFLFVIMYLNLGRDVEGGLALALRRGFGYLVGLGLLGIALTWFARGWSAGPAAPPPESPAPGNTQAIGMLLYSRYLFPFEITSVVLLVAMVGVIVIARGRRGGIPEAPDMPEAIPDTPADRGEPPPATGAAPPAAAAPKRSVEGS
jgi:NADH-quinone oxidoreductase subunit J